MTTKRNKVLQYTADIMIAFSIFFLILSYTKQPEIDTENPDDMTFVYHASASQRDSIFAEYDLDEVLDEELREDLIDYLDSEFATNSGTEDIYTGENTEDRSCELPRDGETIKHGEFVLAYEQRDDVSSICNVQRRTCLYGELNGSFTQRSCKENVQYSYTKEEVISYNTRPTNLYIQPPELAPNRNEDFSTDGKVGETLIPIDQRNNSINSVVAAEDPAVGQVTVTKNSCTTPWGETVEHTHFVKAYRSNLGFSNNLCQVELRMCLDGELQGTFTYPYCEYHDIPDETYLMDQLGDPDSDSDEFNLRQLINTAF